jgi:hypothetical protein
LAAHRTQKKIQLFGFVSSFFCSIETIVHVQPTLGKNSGNQSFQPVLRATRDFHNLMAILKSNNLYQTVESPHERCIFVAIAGPEISTRAKTKEKLSSNNNNNRGEPMIDYFGQPDRSLPKLSVVSFKNKKAKKSTGK